MTTKGSEAARSLVSVPWKGSATWVCISGLMGAIGGGTAIGIFEPDPRVMVSDTSEGCPTTGVEAGGEAGGASGLAARSAPVRSAPASASAMCETG